MSSPLRTWIKLFHVQLNNNCSECDGTGSSLVPCWLRVDVPAQSENSLVWHNSPCCHIHYLCQRSRVFICFCLLVWRITQKLLDRLPRNLEGCSIGQGRTHWNLLLCIFNSPIAEMASASLVTIIKFPKLKQIIWLTRGKLISVCPHVRHAWTFRSMLMDVGAVLCFACCRNGSVVAHVLIMMSVPSSHVGWVTQEKVITSLAKGLREAGGSGEGQMVSVDGYLLHLPSLSVSGERNGGERERAC